MSDKDPKESLIGTDISGCEILQKVAEGGMGAVYKARHKALNRIVCVKILSPALANDKKAVELFLSEARAVAELDHPNIVNVYNVGKERGYYFIVMSFIEGQTLSVMLKRRKVLPVNLVLDLFDGILKGLNVAHEKGIIHRDIKPSNILITSDMHPKIVDFGIAKKVDKEKGTTKTTELAGTAYFIAPEQALGRDLDTRADLYSIGASMYYVLTGQFPYNGKNTIDIIQKHINDPVPDPSKIRKDLPPWLTQAIQKLMSKDPAKRFQTAKETYLFFQKMRAEDQLRLKSGTTGSVIDLETDSSLKIIKESPIENTESIKKKRQEAVLKNTNTGSLHNKPVLLPGLDESPAAAKRKAPIKPAPPANVPVDYHVSDAAPAAPQNTEVVKLGEPKKPLKWRHLLDFGWIPVLMALSLAVSYVFFLFGKICSVETSPNLGFVANLLAPLTSGQSLPNQLAVGAVCLIMLALVFASSSIRAFSRSTMGLLVIAFISYMAGLFTPQVPYWDIKGISQFIFSPEYSLCYFVVAGMWALSLCWRATLTKIEAFLGTSLVILTVVLAYTATGLSIAPDTAGMFTKWLAFLGLLFALMAIYYLTTQKGVNSSIMAPTLCLFAAVACVWIYNTSGLANTMTTTLQVIASKIDAGQTNKSANDSKKTSEKELGYVSLFQGENFAHIGEVKEINTFSPEKKYAYLDKQITIYTKDAIPQAYRPLMIEMLSAYYLSGSSRMTLLAWDYAIGYPIQNFNQNAQNNNAYYFLLTLLYWFGILGCAANIVFREDE